MQSSATDIENAGDNPNKSLNKTKDVVRKLPPAWLMFSLMFSHLLLLHQNFIASGYSTRFANGKAIPNEWGWEETDMVWSPISTDVPPAPEDLLKVIRCNCNTDCSSQGCSCKKHVMKGFLACGKLPLATAKAQHVFLMYCTMKS